MKRVSITSFLFCTILLNTLNAQEPSGSLSQDNRTHLELMILPFGLNYSALSFGISKNTCAKVEQAFTLSGFAFDSGIGLSYSGSFRYNYNVIIRDRKRTSAYIPFWFGTRFFSPPNGESEMPKQHLFYSVGSGFGMKFNLSNRHKLRAELGAGVALNTSASVYIDPKYTVDNEWPVVPSFRLSIKYLIPLGKLQN